MLANLLVVFLVVFNIFYVFAFLFLLIGSQFTFLCGLFLLVFYGFVAFAILDKEFDLPRSFHLISVPLTVLGMVNLIPFLLLDSNNVMHMNVREAIEFSVMYLLPPLFVNLIFLNIPSFKKRFKR